MTRRRSKRHKPSSPRHSAAQLTDSSSKRESTVQQASRPAITAVDEHAPPQQAQSERVSDSTLVQRFLSHPAWLGLGVLVVVVSAAATLAVTRYFDQQKERKAKEESLSTIDYAWFINPAPTPGEEFENTGRWEVSLMVYNAGPRTAETVVLHLTTPPPSILLHSAPVELSSGATTKVEIIERTLNGNVPAGLYQVVFRNFAPGDTVMLGLFYRVPDEEKRSLMTKWHEQRWDKEFARQFVSDFFFTGEHLRISNSGATKLEPSFKSTD